MHNERIGRVPVHVLTGFLGSGKTTLLRRLLTDPALSDTAVIINEFGQVGLDHLLVREVREDILLLKSGCLCCEVKDDLVSTLAELDRQRRAGELPPYSRVVVETTGLALPAPIVEAVLSDPRLTNFVRPGRMVTTVDAVHGESTLLAHPEARQQVAFADQLVITKGDLVAPDARDALAQRLASFNAQAAVTTTGNGGAPLASLFVEDLESAAPGTGWNLRLSALGGQGSGHDPGVQTFAVLLERKVTRAAFVEWLDLLLRSRGDSLLRVKGVIAIEDDPRPVVVQGVRHVLYPLANLASWPPTPAPCGWLVFIARDLTQRAIERSLRSVYVSD